MCALTETLTVLSESNETLSQRAQEFLCLRSVFLRRPGPSVLRFLAELRRNWRWMEGQRPAESALDGARQGSDGGILTSNQARAGNRVKRRGQFLPQMGQCKGRGR